MAHYGFNMESNNTNTDNSGNNQALNPSIFRSAFPPAENSGYVVYHLAMAAIEHCDRAVYEFNSRHQTPGARTCGGLPLSPAREYLRNATRILAQDGLERKKRKLFSFVDEDVSQQKEENILWWILRQRRSVSIECECSDDDDHSVHTREIGTDVSGFNNEQPQRATRAGETTHAHPRPGRGVRLPSGMGNNSTAGQANVDQQLPGTVGPFYSNGHHQSGTGYGRRVSHSRRYGEPVDMEMEEYRMRQQSAETPQAIYHRGLLAHYYQARRIGEPIDMEMEEIRLRIAAARGSESNTTQTNQR